ncbi:putative RNA helicase [Tieghemostelium lacteum]|uniref:RNA helicase n=1 Tax=Tieghemostelium lacteum TaxID=361077 RepID=A0A152A8Z9_TIELA|nr:putative RNA helicase [Tieghemostelium lacteum]|eukprot:KYR02702.1 putative RNA helicase [Tieghemostelium lacteum]
MVGKKSTDKSKKSNGTSNTIGNLKNVRIKEKLSKPTLFKSEDKSFLDQDIFKDNKSSDFDDFNINENYDSSASLFGDLMQDEMNDGLAEDLDLLDFENNNDGDNEDDEDEYQELEFEDAVSSSTNKKNSKEKTQLPELIENFPSVESFEGDGDDEDKGKKKKKKKKTGGFQSFDLGKPLLKAILKKGYTVPTPIQRKTIPLILDGNDVVGMARTGSGKTAAFVIPMVNKLQEHSRKVGARALILSPTRELAVQTFKVVKDFSQGTTLKQILVVGGDSMEDQFTDLATNPDIIIATPGRLMHHLKETGMGLSSVEYVVFDEADRMFEMNFADQLSEILSKLSETRQTMLFSATLPSMLVDFVRAGLNSPKLVRLDTDTKISENLSLSFYTIRHDEKLGCLLYLLRELIDVKTQQTIIFTSTKYHVEFISILLDRAAIPNTHIHGYLDSTARKINLEKFRKKHVNVMVVTDLAARGIDIPLLDNVINFDFPPKEKIFVHRVGRVARAGRSGIAYSLVSSDEVPYMIDLHLYLGRRLVNVLSNGEQLSNSNLSFYGNIPQSIIDRENEFVLYQRKECVELLSLTRTIENAHKKYITTRPAASPESHKRSKVLNRAYYHPQLQDKIGVDEIKRNEFIQGLKAFRPAHTVFEIDPKKGQSSISIMKEKRKFHSDAIESNIKKIKLEKESSATNALIDNEIEQIQKSKLQNKEKSKSSDDQEDFSDMEDENENDEVDEDDEDVNSMQIEEKMKSKSVYNVKIQETEETQPKKKKNSRSTSRDENFFLSNTPSMDRVHEERALSITSRFGKDVEVNLNPDDERASKHKGSMKWDRKKGNFVSVQSEKDRAEAKKKYVRNEAGKLVLSQKGKGTGSYEDWKKKNRTRIQRVGEDENERSMPSKKEYVPQKFRGKNAGGLQEKDKDVIKNKVAIGIRKQKNSAKNDDELKDKHSIIKSREERDRKMKVNKTKATHLKKGGGGGKGKSGGGSGGRGSKFGSGKGKSRK